MGKFRDQLDDFVADADVVRLDDDAWWERFGELLDVVLAATAREKRAARQAVQCEALYRGTTRCVRTREHSGDHYTPATGRWRNDGAPLADAKPEYRDWGVAWFGKNGETGVCVRCGETRRVYQGYNGGAHIAKFCRPCQGAVLRNQV